MTSSIDNPVARDMYPITAKTTKPARILVEIKGEFLKIINLIV